MSDRWAGKVHCLSLTRVSALGSLFATADIALGAIDRPTLIIHGVKVLRGRTGEPLVILPERKIGCAWQPVIEVEDETLRLAVTEVVLAAWVRSLTAADVLLAQTERQGTP